MAWPPLSAKDYGSHFKLILHRAMWTNPHNPQASSVNCRACGLERESVLHFGKCTKLKPIFEVMRQFDGAESWDDTRMNLLGVNPFKGVIPEGTSALHFNLWKFTLIALTKASLEGAPIMPSYIIDSAMRRLRGKIQALSYSISTEKNRCDSRGTVPDFRKYNKLLEGIGSVTPEGYISLEEDLKTLFLLAS